MHVAAHLPNRPHEASHLMEHKLREDGREACVWQNKVQLLLLLPLHLWVWVKTGNYQEATHTLL